MSKYNGELKFIIVQQLLDGTNSIELSSLYSISTRQIRYWSQVFGFKNIINKVSRDSLLIL